MWLRAHGVDSQQASSGDGQSDSEADEGFPHAIDRDEDERERLGAEFFDELRTATWTREAPEPECGPVIAPSRAWRLSQLLVRFPLAIVFVEGDPFLGVNSVMHRRRRPPY